jgi:uncharacterized protein (TIGR02594 family)
MSEPIWLKKARTYIGTAEIPGAATSGTISRWLLDLKAWWRDDETPWCGVFVAACMKEAGLTVLPVHWYRAKGWLDWGQVLLAPAVGCVVVFERKGGGHVGLVVGRDSTGNLMVLGGNQGNRVSIMAFEMGRVIGYRWPNEPGVHFSAPNRELPVVAVAGMVSKQEG